MWRIRIKLSRVLGLLILITVFALIITLFFTSKDEGIKIKSIEIGKDLGIAFFTVVATKNIRNLITIKKGGSKNDE